MKVRIAERLKKRIALNVCKVLERDYSEYTKEDILNEIEEVVSSLPIGNICKEDVQDVLQLILNCSDEVY